MRDEFILQIENLKKKYKKSNIIALDNLTLNIKRGDFFALLGHNGAGKSTLINIATNLIKKYEGQVKVNGINVRKNAKLAMRYIGIVPQEVN